MTLGIPNIADEIILENIDNCISASKECERALAQRQFMQRRMTLNLKIYRDHVQELGKAVWGDVIIGQSQ